MKVFLLVWFSFYFSCEFVLAFCKWTRSKTNKDYGWGLADTLLSAGMIFAFIKLVDLLTEVA